MIVAAEQGKDPGPSATVALDAHGGDHDLAVTVPAAVRALRADPELNIVLVGQQTRVESALSGAGADVGPRLAVHHAPNILPMHARPAEALRRGKESSMWLALALVAEGQAGACVSGGSTAALMTLGVKLIGMLRGIERPALMAHIPNGSGHTAMLDLGANLHVGARQLIQFAVMGSVTAEVADGIDRPRVGLLNVGHEDDKGHDAVREAHQQLKSLALNYFGFMEGYDIYSGKVDVAVCDGFTGNLILKSCEGLARMLEKEVRKAFTSGTRGRLGAWLARPALNRMLARLDPSAHNGAPLLGLSRVVIKSHGGADCKAMTRAILEAGREARRGVPEKIAASIHAFQLEMEV